jgi:RNA polymerase primary sigma factor
VGVAQLRLAPLVMGAWDDDARAGYGERADGRGMRRGAPADLASGAALGLDIYAWARTRPLPTAAEERRLCARMRTGEKAARERLFEAGARWALTIAQWHATDRAPLDDLAQVAWLTLWRTLPTFDPAAGRLTTFVAPAILRDVRRAVDEMSSPIRRPVHVVDAERREWRFYERFAAEHGYEPSLELVAAALDAPPAFARQTQRQMARRPLVVSLDAPHAGSGVRASGATWTLGETLPAPEGSASDPVAQGERADKSARVAQFVAATRLSQRQRQVLALMYSDDPRVADNLAAIGRVLGMTRERVRQVHDSALTQLRKANVRSGGALAALDTYDTLD